MSLIAIIFIFVLFACANRYTDCFNPNVFKRFDNILKLGERKSKFIILNNALTNPSHCLSGKRKLVLSDGFVFFSLPTYFKRKWLRCILLNPYINEKTIQTGFFSIDQFTQIPIE